MKRGLVALILADGGVDILGASVRTGTYRPTKSRRDVPAEAGEKARRTSPERD